MFNSRTLLYKNVIEPKYIIVKLNQKSGNYEKMIGMGGLISEVMEADAGVIMYFDPFLNEWVTLGGESK